MTDKTGNNDKDFCYWDGDVLVLNILGTPSAKRDKILKPRGNQLKVSVTASPEGGKATDYMVKFLSKEFGVKISDIDVVFGQTSIHKQLRINAPKKLPDVIQKALKGPLNKSHKEN
jgi:uncharacterized protein (TIGR00251 family)